MESAEEGVMLGRHIFYRNSRLEQSYAAATHEDILEVPWQKNAKKVHGRLTHALVASLYSFESPAISYNEWAQRAVDTYARYDVTDGGASRAIGFERLSRSPRPSARTVMPLLDGAGGPPYLASQARHETIFSNTVFERNIQASLEVLLDRDSESSALTAIQIAQRILEEPKGRAAELHLDVGLLAGVLGNYKLSLDALKAAEESARGDSEPLLPLIKYHHGRVSFLNGDLDRAMSDLRSVIKDQPESASARYYLGSAIREQVTRDLLQEARNEFDKYLSAGAPLGHRDEVQRFLQDHPRYDDR
jgi:tetratricopeptide (TPR) repeat protein